MTDMLQSPTPVVPSQDRPAVSGVPTRPRAGTRGTAVAVGAVVLGLVVGTGAVAGQAFDPGTDEATSGPGTAYATETARVLGEDLEAGIGRFRATRDGLGLVSSRLPVRLTNTAAEPRSYDVVVAAFAADGTRVARDTAVVDRVAPGERHRTVLFELVDDETAAALESARFRVVRATAY